MKDDKDTLVLSKEIINLQKWTSKQLSSRENNGRLLFFKLIINSAFF